MIAGLERVKSRRMWYVPEVSIWGLAVWDQIEFVLAEEIESEQSLLFGQVDLADDAQQLLYADLVDHRGNQLPETIESPLVLIRSRGEHRGYVVGRESGQGFKVARESNATSPVTGDLLVIEMGS